MLSEAFIRSCFSFSETVTMLKVDNFTDLKNALVNLKPHSDSYLNCPIYYLLTGRNGGFMVSNGKTGFVVCAHPNLPAQYILMPEIGRGDSRLLTRQVMQNMLSKDTQLVLGKYSKNEACDFNQNVGLTLSEYEDETMDWVFPTRIHSTDTLAAVDGSSFVKIRNMIRAAERADIDVQFVSKISPNDIKSMVEIWRERHDLAENISDSYYGTLSELVATHLEEFGGMRVLDKKQNLVGLLVWRISGCCTANVYAQLTLRGINGLADLMLHRLAKFLKSEGIKWINVGGSESRSLDQYKRKFQPVVSLEQLSFKFAKFM